MRKRKDNAAAAPATVSGEPSDHLMPLGSTGPGKVVKGRDPRARRPATSVVMYERVGRGAPGRCESRLWSAVQGEGQIVAAPCVTADCSPLVTPCRFQTSLRRLPSSRVRARCFHLISSPRRWLRADCVLLASADAPGPHRRRTADAQSGGGLARDTRGIAPTGRQRSRGVAEARQAHGAADRAETGADHAASRRYRSRADIAGQRHVGRTNAAQRQPGRSQRQPARPHRARDAGVREHRHPATDARAGLSHHHRNRDRRGRRARSRFGRRARDLFDARLQGQRGHRPLQRNLDRPWRHHLAHHGDGQSRPGRIPEGPVVES